MQWGNGPEGGYPAPPFPHKPPCSLGDRAPPGPLHDCPLFCFLFFLQTLPAPPRPGTHQPLRTAGWAPPAPHSARRLCIRSVPGRYELRAPGRAARTMGGCRGGFLSLVAPSPSQIAVSSPSGPQGQGAGGNAGRLSSHGGTKDQGIRDQESNREPAEEGEGTRAEGVQGAGERALPGAASRLFPQPPPLPPPRPLSAAQLFHESPPPRPFVSRFPAALLDPGNCRRDCDPGPERWSGGCLDSWPGPTLQPLLRLFSSTRLSETEPPDPEGWPCSIL